jgi:hypothetical protein
MECLFITSIPQSICSQLQFLFTPGAQDVRQEYMDVESQYMERKGSYDKVAVGLEIDKQNLEKECDSIQVSIMSSSYSAYQTDFRICTDGHS